MPTDSPVCPRCAGAHVVSGAFPGGRGESATGFQPAGLRFWTFRQKVAPLIARNGGQYAWGCLACGLAWSQVNAAKLRRIIDETASDETRARYAEALSSGEISPLKKTEHD